MHLQSVQFGSSHSVQLCAWKRSSAHRFLPPNLLTKHLPWAVEGPQVSVRSSHQFFFLQTSGFLRLHFLLPPAASASSVNRLPRSAPTAPTAATLMVVRRDTPSSAIARVRLSNRSALKFLPYRLMPPHHLIAGRFVKRCGPRP